jgi:hypothetical protein
MFEQLWRKYSVHLSASAAAKDYSTQIRILAKPEPFPIRVRNYLNKVWRPENGGWVTKVGAEASAIYTKGAGYDNGSVGRPGVIL